MRQRIKQGLLVLVAAVVIVVTSCVLGGIAIQWSGGELPELKGQVGAFQIVAHTTVAPNCSPMVPCTQQFADVPLPRYYVVWVITQNATNVTGTRLLTIPLQLSLTL
jgi:hypothetical protein